MSRRERDDAALEAEIARLPDLGHDELRKRWNCCSDVPRQNR